MVSYRLLKRKLKGKKAIRSKMIKKKKGCRRMEIKALHNLIAKVTTKISMMN